MASSKKYFRGSTDGKAPHAKDPLDGAKDHYDLIVIGSGLAGLTSANVMARAGFSVLLVEQHYNYGGMATWFKRPGGHIFDISLHGFPVGMKKTCRKYWSKEIADRIVPLDSVQFRNPQFDIETSFTKEDFTRHLVETFGLTRKSVDDFFEHVRKMNFYDDSGETTGELFEAHFPGRNDVHRLLMEPISYANGSSLQDPAISYGIVFSNFMSKGVYTYIGGTDHFVKQMRGELQKSGVELRNRVQVDRIIIEDGMVAGIEANGRTITADAVISNSNLKSTILSLVGKEHFRPQFVQEVEAVRLNNSSTQVYMGIKAGETVPFVTDLLFTSTRKEFDSPSLCDLHGDSRTFSFYYPTGRPGSDRYTIVSSTNANWDDWANFSETEYEANKARLIEDTLVALERLVPGTRSKINYTEASTPRTFKFYTQHNAGSSFGTKFEGLGYSMDLSKEIPGLYHAGSVGIIMSGWLGAANYGVITANKVDAYLHQLQSQIQEQEVEA
ncbi:MAG: all-trans-retinol 13,14-reductase [Planctomycetota bacterium]|jgi:all-trans-retinol 13,14-reductase